MAYAVSPFLLTFICVAFFAKWTTVTESQIIHNSETENDIYRKQIIPTRNINMENSAPYNNVILDQMAREVVEDKNRSPWVSGASVKCDRGCKQNTNNAYVNGIGHMENESLLGDIDKRLYTPIGFSSHLGKRNTDTAEYGLIGQIEKRSNSGFTGPFGRMSPTHFVSQLGRLSSLGFVSQLGKRAVTEFVGQFGKRASKGFVSQLGKIVPLGFVSQIGKRAPMGFVSQLGKSVPMGFVSQLGKRASMGFSSQLGKRAPMGFASQLGKRAPMGFVSQLGKRAPMGFVSQLGKRAPMGFVSQLGKRAPMRFASQLEKRVPMGFMSQLGKHYDSPVYVDDNSKENEITLRRKRASALSWISSRKHATSSEFPLNNRGNTNISFVPQSWRKEDTGTTSGQTLESPATE